MSLPDEIGIERSDLLISRYSADEAYYDGRSSSTSDRTQALRASIFAEIANPDLTILDFGCGNGGVLRRLSAKRRIGVEVGKIAAAEAGAAGVQVVGSLADVPSESIDFGISCHALEHVSAPFDVLVELRRVMRPGAPIRLVIPAEISFHKSQRGWRVDRNMHVYAWTPLSFGNLAAAAGFKVTRARLAPMPSGSRLLKAVRYLPWLRRGLAWLLAYRRNALSVVLDARAPGTSGAGREPASSSPADGRGSEGEGP